MTEGLSDQATKTTNNNKKLSRKKFTDDIGYLFGDDEDAEILSEESVLLSGKGDYEKKRNGGSRASHGKNFSSDLENFLKEAFEESFEAHAQGATSAASMDSQIKKRNRRPSSGLDLLIRSTVEPIITSETDAHIRRVTLLVDQKKLEKLKTIARLERTYLKNIVDDIVETYIESYEQQKGNVE